MKRKKYSVVIFTMILSIVLALTFAACTKPADEEDVGGGGGTTPPTANEVALGHLKTVSTALSNSISADLANGFYVGLSGDAQAGDRNWSFDLDANVLSKNAEGVDENNNFRLELKKGTETIFGLYNDKTNLYLQSGANLYNFENASVMKALRTFVALNVPEFNGLTTLDQIMIGTSTIKDYAKDLLPIALSILSTDTASTDAKANLAVSANGNKVTVKLFLKNLDGLLPDVDLSALNGIVVDLSVTTENNFIKNIAIALNYKETQYALSLHNKVSGGLFSEIKQDLDAAVPTALIETTASSIIQTDFAGKMNFLVDNAEGKETLKSFDWKLVSKLDLLTLVDNNFMFSSLPKENFFHFQLSHTCNATCEAYCAGNIVSAALDSKTRYKNTSIIDIAWSPSTMDTNNIVADISLWDLLSQRALDKVLTAVAKKPISNASQMASMMISSQFVLNLDPDTLLLKDNTIAREVPPVENPEDPAVDPSTPIDLSKILSLLNGLVSLDNNALTLDTPQLKNLISEIAGTAPILGLTAGELIDIILDTNLDNTITDAEGKDVTVPKLISGISFTCEKSNFGHNAAVAGYNTYEKAIQYNMNGDKKMLMANGMNAYGGFDLMANKPQGNSPAMYTKGVTMDDGVLRLYALSTDGKTYTLVSDKDTAISNYDIEVTYGGLKNLYFEYTYVDFEKVEKKAYGSIFGFQGLNLNTTATQDVKLLTSLMMGNGGLYKTMVSNLKGLLSMVAGGATIELPNLETIIPATMDTFDCKINFNASAEAPVVPEVPAA